MFLDSTRHIDMSEENDGGLDSVQQNRIILAIDEAVANIIEHGYPDERALSAAQISLTMRKDAQKVEFEICDNGVAFNPLEHKSDTELYYEEGLEDGVGLLALTVLDCAYERTKDEKNLLRIKRDWSKKI